MWEDSLRDRLIPPTTHPRNSRNWGDTPQTPCQRGGCPSGLPAAIGVSVCWLRIGVTNHYAFAATNGSDEMLLSFTLSFAICSAASSLVSGLTMTVALW